MSTMAEPNGVSPADGPSTGNALFGHAAVFDTWTEIHTPGQSFLERIAPGAFADTLRERGDRVRVILEHGKDARAGNRPLGEIVSLQEDERGLAYQVDLFDVPYAQELKPALSAGLYSASFRFRSRLEDFEPRPRRSSYNPKRLPEVTLRSVDLFEFGPVLFPAYPGATAALRSDERPALRVLPNKPFEFWFAVNPERFSTKGRSA